ncbi:hypothetical protein DDE82_002280 [Stemphylium lycopersici]|nr:hypothetical protein TW65_05252 [Stemphylium lycopersici]RAR08661.1 hypothetical protein DDE82_002280 [Stemphylium lycopersici]
MNDREDTNERPNQPQVNTPSPNRPPQFNERNCGYDCGYGCEKASEDEAGGGYSDEETVVEDTNEDMLSNAEFQSESDGEMQDLSSSQGSMPISDGVDWDETCNQLPDANNMSASLMVEPFSPADHSPPASISGSARSVSPNPGVVYWVTSLRVATPLPMSYHFLQTPLRLSPQLEHCRGDPTSHLVVPDRSALSYVMEQLAREYAPGYGHVSPPRFGAC